MLITAVFFYTTGANMIERPDGIKIASWFIIAIVGLVVLVARAAQHRAAVQGVRVRRPRIEVPVGQPEALEFPVLVPHRPGRRGLDEKEASIRRRHRLPTTCRSCSSRPNWAIPASSSTAR